MKRVFLVIVIFLVAGMVVYAQAADRPTTSQVRSEAQQYLTQARSNSSQFESTVEDHNTRNTSNSDADEFNRLKGQIDRLEARINTEQTRVDTSLSNGQSINIAAMRRIQQLIDQHKVKMDELEAFIATMAN